MALHGTFYLNGKDYSLLEFTGIGRFTAYSGNREFRNKPGCGQVKNNGPLPVGRYWIVDRPTGGWYSRFLTWGSGEDRSDWFGLYRDDRLIDDYMWINGVQRGNFRLHSEGLAQLSLGCLTLKDSSEFLTLRNALLRTSKVRVGAFMAYGHIEVVAAYEDDCPLPV